MDNTNETAPTNRRRFVSTSLSKLAGLAAGTSAVGGARPARAQSPNDKVVLALIGAGGRGSYLARQLAAVENTEFKYICEVNDARGEQLIQELEKIRGRRPQRVRDMRRIFEDSDVDGVVIATPEHWHALGTVWACQAGKDVYVEKNISLFIWEGRKMMEAARKYKRIVQCGTQNRSAPYGFTAREYIQSGKLGRPLHAKVYNLQGGGGAWRPGVPTQPPPGLNWDMWVGFAPDAPYSLERTRWGNYWDYCGGTLSGDGSHQLDLARMVLGDPPHPKAVYCAGGRFAYNDHREVPDLQVVTFDYGDFVMTHDNGSLSPYMKKFQNEVRYGKTWPYWPQSSCRIEIYGTKQLMYLGRHGVGWQVMETDGKVAAEDKGYHPDKWHLPNFVDCIRTRKQPNGGIEQGHYSACLSHLANIAYRVGNQRLIFDGNAEMFVNSEQANRLVKPAYRGQYRIPDRV